MGFDRTSYINSEVSIKKELNFFFKSTDPIIIFDIGACEGESSVQYARLFPKSNIYAFEPLPSNIKLIHESFLKYAILNASYYNKALSNINGIATFHVSNGNPENGFKSDWDFGNKSSSLLAPGKHLEVFEFINFDKKIKVETITLKSFCQQNKIKTIDFIHMDVQGAELMVLEGAEDFISNIKTIWLEVSKVSFYKDQPLVSDIKSFMSENNFMLIKNELHGDQGDQLYVSKNFYPFFKLFVFAKFNSLKKRAVDFLQRFH